MTHFAAILIGTFLSDRPIRASWDGKLAAPDGAIIGREIHHGLTLCDLCGQTWRPLIAFHLAS